MKVYIPTVGREDRQFTLRYIPDSWKDRTYLVCPKEENHDWPNRIDVPPECIGSYGRTTQFIMEQSDDPLVAQIDDDLNFYKKEKIDSSKLIRLPDAEPIFNLMEQWLEEGEVYCGVSNSFWCQDKPEEYYHGKPSHSCFVNRDYLAQNSIRFDAIPYYVDFHVPLSVLESGRRLRYTGWYVAREVRPNGPGGNSLYRTAAKNKEGMLSLAAKHPKYVKVKEAPGATNQTLVIDLKMRIEFAKAYRENVRGT